MNTKNNKTVEQYLKKQTQYQGELAKLREIILSVGLEETIKWGAPCYTHKGKNVVGMAAFKQYFGLWFHQGALLEDKHGHLINAQEGTTQAQRQWRMQNASDIKPRILKQYLKEALSLAEAGKAVPIQRNKPLTLPEELKSALAKSKKLKTAFEQFSLSKQREFAEHISNAKQAATKSRRLEKILPMIQAGTGLNDKYR